MMHFYNGQEPDNVNEKSSHAFTVAAAGGDISNGSRGLDHYGQELLAECGQIDRLQRSWCIEERIARRVRVQHDDTGSKISDDAFWRPVIYLTHNGSTDLDPGWREVASPFFADPKLRKEQAEMERLAGGSL
jgi:hypothetical protein